MKPDVEIALPGAMLASESERDAARGHIALLEQHACRLQGRGGGGNVVWRRFGTGPDLVLLHGGHGSWLHWVRNIDALARCFTVWVPDLPGYHDSDDSAPGDSDDDRFERLVARLTESWASIRDRVEPIVLAGFSFGALVASAWALRDRSVRRLVLVGPGGHGTTRRPVAPLKSWKVANEDSDRRAAIVHNLRAHLLHDPGAADALAQVVHEDACLMTRFRSSDLSHSTLLVRLLREFERPTVFIWGEHDVTASPPQAASLLCDGRPERKALIIKGAGHWVQYERPGEVDREILAGLPPVRNV